MRNLRPSETVLLVALGAVVVAVVTWAAVVRVQFSSATARVEVQGEQIVSRLNLQGFREIEATGKWRIDLRHGDEWQIELTYPDALAQHVRSGLQGNRLLLDFDPPLWEDGPEFPASAKIVIPALELADIKGYSRVELQGFEGERLELAIKGNAVIEGRDGRYRTLGLSAAGLSEIDLSGIEVRDANVEIAGNTRVVLSMGGGSLSGYLKGAGSLSYSGQVSEESVRIAGIARVKRLD